MARTLKTKYFLAASVALAALIIYLPALRNEFVNWDDGLYVVANFHIRSLDAAFFRWAFFDFHASNWHPLTWISHAMDYAFWGLNPLGHHLTSIILHAVNTALVVVLALKLLDVAREGSTQNASVSFLNDRTAMIAAGVTGLLFGIHPVHVESVAWVSERKDLLCALFFLLTIMAYMSYVSCKTYKTFILTLVFFVLALMSKPMAVTLPLVLSILDWYPFNRIQSLKTLWKASIEKIPFFALSLASSVITILAQRAGNAIPSLDIVPLSARIHVAARSLIAYLENMLLPLDLIPFYPYPQDVSLFSFEYISSIILMLGITAACIALVKKQKLWSAAWGYYVVTLIPVLGIVQVGAQAMADRYTYLPSLGPFLIIGIIAAAVSEKAGRATQRGIVVVSSVAALLVLAFLSYLTIGQIGVWRTSVDLWSAVIKKEPGTAPLAYCNRGQAFMETGQIEKAIDDYSAAVTLKPSYHEAFYNRGIAFEKAGRPDRAIEDYERTIELNPSSYQAYNNRGILYGTAGLYDRAIEFFTRALAINPGDPDSYFNRGFTYSLTGRSDRALADFTKAIELNQQFALAYLHRGKLLFGMDRKDLAAADFRKACELGISEACSALP